MKQLPHTWLGKNVPYSEALILQKSQVESVYEDSSKEIIYLLEHEPIYTIGRTRDKSSLREANTLPHPVEEISRGGQATYHGPGQLVGYLILDLSSRGKDLHAYMRALEDALIAMCQEFSVPAGRAEGKTGVWIGPRKLASIGVGVRRWVSSHGFAINITDEALDAFDAITPCGLSGVSMTSLSRESGKNITVQEAGLALLPHLQTVISKM